MLRPHVSPSLPLRRVSSLLACVVVGTAALSCAQAQPKPEPVAAPAAPRPVPPGVDESLLDAQVSPCEDFFRYACGGWLDKTEIPADRATYSRGFTSIADKNELELKAILDDAAAGKLPEGTPYAQQLGDYYATCMDESKLDAALPEIKKKLASLSSVKNASALAKTIAQLHLQGFGALFSTSSGQDYKDPTQVIAFVDQGGLGLPDREYYLNTDDKTKAVREAYAAHVGKMFELLGDKPEVAAKKSATVMAFETALAKASLDKVSRRDPDKTYHRLDRAGLKGIGKTFPWDAYFDALGRKDFAAINVSWPDYFTAVDALSKTTKADVWSTYLSWVVLRSSIPSLPKAFADERFHFESAALTGAKEDRPRWKKCVAWTDAALGEALGNVFVQRTFGADGKDRTNRMVQAVEKSFEKNLDSLAWMDASTRAAALQKVQRMNNKIGYPDAWRDYSSMKTSRASFLDNVLAADAFAVRRDLDKVGKPVDKNEWYMSPPTVNAYNDPQQNEIVFPAGILQPPFFDRAATDAVNFGAMGMVVGHEITHGFDDEGRKFDHMGALRDWWSPESGKQFEGKTACVKQQFDDYVAIDDVHVNGALTLGENVADLGGLKLSHQAMEAWQQANPTTQEYRYTATQQFFLGYAQSWCTKVRPEMARVRAATDPHSPPFLRVNGPLSNLDTFAAAFGCKEGDKMVRPAAQRCQVW